MAALQWGVSVSVDIDRYGWARTGSSRADRPSFAVSWPRARQTCCETRVAILGDVPHLTPSCILTCSYRLDWELNLTSWLTHAQKRQLHSTHTHDSAAKPRNRKPHLEARPSYTGVRPVFITMTCGCIFIFWFRYIILTSTHRLWTFGQNHACAVSNLAFWLWGARVRVSDDEWRYVLFANPIDWLIVCIHKYIYLRLQLSTKNPNTRAKRNVEIFVSASGSNMNKVAAAMIKIPALWLRVQCQFARVQGHIFCTSPENTNAYFLRTDAPHGMENDVLWVCDSIEKNIPCAPDEFWKNRI